MQHEDIRWDLTHLYPNSSSLKADLKDSLASAERLRDRYRGQIASLDVTGLREAYETLGGLHDRIGRAYTYAYLNWCTQTSDEAAGALLQEVKEAYAAFQQQTVFFATEWAQLDDIEARTRFEAPELAFVRHTLEVQTKARVHSLSEAEEQVMAEMDLHAADAWTRFFDQLLGAHVFTLREERLTEQEVLAKLHDPDRALRRDAALSLTAGLQALAPQLTFIFNTVIANKKSSDELRKYPHWIASRNVSNEMEDTAVEALVEAVTSRYDIAQRFYRLKTALLGVERMEDYDRYAPVRAASRMVSWEEARDLVLEAYSGFHPEMGRIAERFFSESWIDAFPRPGKRGGAFSHGAVPSAHPYVMMNYLGRARDVQTLAHELGHGVHQYLSRQQGIYHADTPLTTAETASVFGEMLTFHLMLERESDPAERLALLVGKIDDTMATVYRQIAMNRFEHAIHTARRTEGELSFDRFAALWMDTQRALYGNEVHLGEHYRYWWSYIPHFLHTPGYVYAYAFGELLVLSLYARFKAEGSSFPEKYLGLLAAGGSDWPHILVGALGVDLNDPHFWHQGLAAIEALVEDAERQATQLNSVAVNSAP